MRDALFNDPEASAKTPWEAARFLKQVMSTAPNLIYVFNQETQSNEYSNRSVGRFLGYNEQEVLAFGAALIPELCHPSDLPIVISHFERIKSIKDGITLQLEYRMRHKQGHWVWLLSNDTVFERDAAGKVLRHLGTATNISAQKAAEEEAQREHLKACSTNDELRAFSYSISHDLKAPSSTVMLILNELLESQGDALDADGRHLVTMALGTAKRMAGLVDDVLSYTQMVDQAHQPEEVDLAAMVSDVVIDLTASIRAENASINICDLPIVLADRRQMRVLFQNLLANAIKFHRPGENPVVRVTADTLPHLKQVEITVADNGIGIDPTKHQQIFQVFKRLNGLSDYEGTGLGLAICRRIASNHGTAIILNSQPNEGAAFSIRLPLT
ncbi:MAG: ATP-binding protein [Pseudomonadota bacterium]